MILKSKKKNIYKTTHAQSNRDNKMTETLSLNK